MYEVTPDYENLIYGSTRIIRGSATLGGIELRDSDNIQSISITRPAIGDALIGSALSAKIKLTALDPPGQLANIKDGAKLSVSLGVEEESTGAVEETPFQPVTCDSVEYDPDSKICTASGFDDMALLDAHTFAELKIVYPATLRQIAETAAAKVGISLSPDSFFMEDQLYTEESPANFGGSETLRQLIAWVAEAALSNAIIGRNGQIQFISMIPDSAVSTIDAKDYFEFEPSSQWGPINTFVLGRLPQEDNIFREDSVSVSLDGTKELRINDNPFLDGRREQVIDEYFARVNGLKIIPYTLDWRGNPALDPGDNIQTVDSKNNPVTVFFGNSEIDFDGGLRFNTTFEIKSLTETDKSKASSTGETVRRTQIEVDKVKQEITSVVEKTEGYDKQFSEINQKLDEISSTVGEIETQTTYKLYLISTNGDTFKGSAWSTVLQAVVYSTDKEVTSELQDSQFKWSRTSSDTESDSEWDASHGHGVKQINVSSADIQGEQSTFSCVFSSTEGKPQAVAQVTITIVQDGQDGQDGRPGQPGQPGQDGEDGKDGEDAAIISATEPEDKTKLWCDTSVEPPQLKRWDGTKWVIVGDMSETVMEIYNEMYSAINQTAEDIRLEVSETTYAKGEVDQMIQQLNSSLEQTSEDFTFRLTETKGQLQEGIDQNSDDLSDYKTQIETYMRFSADGLELGKSDSPFTTQLDNEGLYFSQDGTKIAYVNNNKLYITNAEVLDRFTVGNTTSGYFDWIPRENGNLGMKWRSANG